MSKRLLFALLSLAALAVLWFLVGPLLFNRTVNEEAPPELSDAQRDALHQFEQMTPEQVEKLSPRKRSALEEEMAVIAKAMTDTSIADAMPKVQATILASGSFADADSVHRGSGKATVYRLPDGADMLRLENMRVTNGPALHVYLVRDANGDVASGFVDLGSLKGNIGDQNYDIPAGTDTRQFKSVVIWCKPFGVTFSIALLQ